jgi:hypothetical protein
VLYFRTPEGGRIGRRTSPLFESITASFISRKVIGYAISKRIDGQLTVDAPKMAILRRKPPRVRRRGIRTTIPARSRS